MKQFNLACKAFFRTLRSKKTAQQIETLFAGEETSPATPTLPEPKEKVPVRSDAISLIALLQQEARLLDFLQENLDGFADEQIGAAVRDIHRNASKVIQKVFNVKALRNEGEGNPVEIASGFNPTRTKLTGSVAGDPPYQGVLRHQGWEAQQCELPTWSGAEQDAMVIAPAEVEVA